MKQEKWNAAWKLFEMGSKWSKISHFFRISTDLIPEEVSVRGRSVRASVRPSVRKYPVDFEELK